MLFYMRKYKQKFGYKVKLRFLTTILKVWLYGATRWLHLINYLEPLVGPNRRLIGATLSLGWLQIAYPFKVQPSLLTDDSSIDNVCNFPSTRFYCKYYYTMLLLI